MLCSLSMKRNLPILVLIVSLAFVFGYFGIDKFVDPLLWMGFLPAWMNGLLGMDKTVWVKIVGSIEIVIALMLLIPQRTVRMAGAVLVPLHLLAVLAQVSWNDVGVRDIGLLLSAVALFLLLRQEREKA